MPKRSSSSRAWLKEDFTDPGNVLKPGGSALIKTFQGPGFHGLVMSTREHCEKVKLLKPEASRARSPGPYLLASGLVMV